MMKVSFLITHFNRIDALKQCIASILKINQFDFEIVVSDDGSNIENVEKLKTLPIDVLVLDNQNSGLGININKGLKKCTGRFIFYIQEDFQIDSDKADLILKGIELLNNKKVDLIRFFTPYEFNDKKNIDDFFYKIPNWSFKNFSHNQFRYSDWPHLKRNKFHDQFGYYLENAKVLYTENEFMVRMMNLNPVIAASYQNICSELNVSSVREDLAKTVKRYKFKNTLRAVRFTVEMILYNKLSRKLKTFTFKPKNL